MGKILNKIDDVREKIEDALADLLAKIDKNKPLDETEKTIITTGLRTGLNALGFSISDEQIEKIVTPIVEVGFSTVNKKVQKQLRKKNKKYMERHKNDEIE